MFCFLGRGLATEPTVVLQRAANTYDRANLFWKIAPSRRAIQRQKRQPMSLEEEREEAKKRESRNDYRDAFGWMEFDFIVAEDGWYELEHTGLPAPWPVDVTLDQTIVFFRSTSSKTEDVHGGWTKIGNLYLGAGPHTIRFLRHSHPVRLINGWRLVAAANRPEACINAAISDQANILRIDGSAKITVTAGTSVPLKYDLFLYDELTKELTPAGHIEFPATSKPVKKVVPLAFPRQGTYRLIAKVGSMTLAPADLKAPSFIAVDMTHAPEASADLNLTKVLEIDCVRNTINGKQAHRGDGFYEKYGESRTVETALGAYRETSGKGDFERWGMCAFSYRFDLPDIDHLYRLEVDYPDNTRRTMGFWINDFAGTPGQPTTGGVETGDRYRLSNTMLTHVSYFYPNRAKNIVFAVISLMRNKRAAAARVRIYRVESPLPLGPASIPDGRQFGFSFEEPGRWLKFFGARGETPADHLQAFERWGQWSQHIGANVMYPTVHIYGQNLYPSRLVYGCSISSLDYCRLGGLIAEKYDCDYIPEVHLGNRDEFQALKLGYQWESQHRLNPKARWQHQRVISKTTLHLIRDDANSILLYHKNSGIHPTGKLNPLHPEVQTLYIDYIGELADRLKDLPAFKGVSSRLMEWQGAGWNMLFNNEHGYGDWTVSQFETDTGVDVPVANDAPDRYIQRYEYLMKEPMRERWIAWRCQRMADYFRRIRDRIQKAKPSAQLFLTLHRAAQPPGETSFSDSLRGYGLDMTLYTEEPGIRIMPRFTYGRRRAALAQREVPDAASKNDEMLFNEEVMAVANAGERGWINYTSYFETLKYPWEELGGSGQSGFDACVPAGIHEREMYAIPLASADIALFLNAGNGWLFGTSEILHPFLREYKALPSTRFTKAPVQQDPVAVWQASHKGHHYLYLVNRLPCDIQVRLHIDVAANQIRTLVGGNTVPLPNSMLSWKLAPYMLKGYVSDSPIKIKRCETSIDPSLAMDFQIIMDFAKTLRREIYDGTINRILAKDNGYQAKKISVPIDPQSKAVLLKLLDDSLASYSEKRYWRAWANLWRAPLVRVYDIYDRWPPTLRQRIESKPNLNDDKEIAP